MSIAMRTFGKVVSFLSLVSSFHWSLLQTCIREADAEKQADVLGIVSE